MYLEYWGIKKYPFDNVPDPDFFFMSKPHEEGLTRLLYAVERGKGCALLSGEVGAGKTTLGKVLLRKISKERYDIAMIANPCLETKEFLQDILYKLGITDVPDSKVEILRILYKKLTDNLDQNKGTLLIIDEAQFIAESTLEEIRLLLNYQLSNRFLLTIFLMGQPELVDKVKAIKQLAQRVEISYFLRSFNFEETTDYIFFREKKAGLSKNVFSKQAIEIIFEHSNGIPRIINNLCDLALLVGSGEKKTMITYEVIKDIIDDGAVF